MHSKSSRKTVWVNKCPLSSNVKRKHVESRSKDGLLRMNAETLPEHAETEIGKAKLHLKLTSTKCAKSFFNKSCERKAN